MGQMLAQGVVVRVPAVKFHPAEEALRVVDRVRGGAEEEAGAGELESQLINHPLHSHSFGMKGGLVVVHLLHRRT